MAMLAENRWEKIVEIVSERNSCSVRELADELNTSEATIRRDIIALDKAGRVQKVHGGVMKARNSFVLTDQTVSEKHTLHPEEKEKIGRYAASLIKENAFVYIDAGTTTEALARHITVTSATYVTNSITIARILLQKGMQVIIPGGRIKNSTEAMIGSETVDAIRSFNFTIGFFGANGVNEKNGFMTPEINEATVKKTAMHQCRVRYVLCDHSKFSIISPITFAGFNEAQIITDFTDELSEEADNVYSVKGEA